MKHLLFALLPLGFASAAWAAAPPEAGTLPTRDDMEAFPPGAWTLVVFPDTQYYVDHTRRIPPTPEVFRAMSEWVVAQKEARNIGMVLHVGDIVDNNTPEEWAMARDVLSPLNGEVPYVLATGNHEYTGNARLRETSFNAYFRAADNPLNDPQRGGTLVSTMEPHALENAAYAWTAPDGRALLFIALEWAPRDQAVAWANQVVAEPRFADHTAVLITHAYLYHDNTLFDWATRGNTQSANPHRYPMAQTESVHDGAELWRHLVSRHPSFEMVFCGHVSGTQAERMYHDDKAEVGYLRGVGAGDQRVHQMLFNAQRRGDAGDGWLRLLEFQPDGRTVIVKTYSPWRDARGLNAWRSDPDDYFRLTLSAFGT